MTTQNSPIRATPGDFGIKFARHTPPHRTCGIKLALLARNGPFWQVSCVQGELCTAYKVDAEPVGHNRTPSAAGVEGAGVSGGPDRGAGWRRQGQGGPRDRHFRAAGSRVAISRAGRRPPAHTAAGPSGARNTRGATSSTINRAGRRPRAHRAARPTGQNVRRPEHQRRQATQHQAPQHHARHTKNRHPDRMSACGGARGIRTPDLLIANETRYQLRHSPKDSNSLAPSQSATQADHRRVRHTMQSTHATAPQARRPAARHQQLREVPYWARRASRTASRSRATA